MEILDNTEGKRLVDSLRANLDDEAKLSIISAHFSLFAFGELREELERLDSVRFLALHNWGCSWGLNPPVSRSARVM